MFECVLARHLQCFAWELLAIGVPHSLLYLTLVQGACKRGASAFCFACELLHALLSCV